jgi:hypothetical protein
VDGRAALPRPDGDRRRPCPLVARGIEADALPVRRRSRIAVLSLSPLAGGGPAGSPGAPAPARSPRRSTRRRPRRRRYDTSLPENKHKLEVVDALARLAEHAGASLLRLAIAFVIPHPAVTAAVTVARTEQLESRLPAADLRLDDELLDRTTSRARPAEPEPGRLGLHAAAGRASGAAAAAPRSAAGSCRRSDPDTSVLACSGSDPGGRGYCSRS